MEYKFHIDDKVYFKSDFEKFGIKDTPKYVVCKCYKSSRNTNHYHLKYNTNFESNVVFEDVEEDILSLYNKRSEHNNFNTINLGYIKSIVIKESVGDIVRELTISFSSDVDIELVKHCCKVIDTDADFKVVDTNE